MTVQDQISNASNSATTAPDIAGRGIVNAAAQHTAYVSADVLCAILHDMSVMAEVIGALYHTTDTSNACIEMRLANIEAKLDGLLAAHGTTSD